MAKADQLRPAELPPVKVYTRLGDDERERTIAFKIPSGMDPMDLLERGATIDGNQAVLTVALDYPAYQPNPEYTCPDLNDGQNYTGMSMTRVLGDCQRGLVKFFRERGYTVEFA